MCALLEEPTALKQWEKPSLTVLPTSETQNAAGPGGDTAGHAS